MIIESHIDPDNAWSDAKQQVTPRNLDLKDVLSMSDRYNITVNRYTSSGSGGDTFMYGAYAADAGGYGGGDAGGGGGGDGGGG